MPPKSTRTWIFPSFLYTIPIAFGLALNYYVGFVGDFQTDPLCKFFNQYFFVTQVIARNIFIGAWVLHFLEGLYGAYLAGANNLPILPWWVSVTLFGFGSLRDLLRLTKKRHVQ